MEAERQSFSICVIVPKTAQASRHSVPNPGWRRGAHCNACSRAMRGQRGLYHVCVLSFGKSCAPELDALLSMSCTRSTASPWRPEHRSASSRHPHTSLDVHPTNSRTSARSLFKDHYWAAFPKRMLPGWSQVKRRRIRRRKEAANVGSKPVWPPITRRAERLDTDQKPSHMRFQYHDRRRCTNVG